jgi:hypothetical protein
MPGRRAPKRMKMGLCRQSGRQAADPHPEGVPSPSPGCRTLGYPTGAFRLTLKGLDRGTPVVKPFQGFGAGHGRVSPGFGTLGYSDRRRPAG